ncbi:MAG: hypothetical protein JOZ41_16655 [Chloroflexi bacterium]|nr:hypothetical protein [Chloroflexota bacterium]
MQRPGDAVLRDFQWLVELGLGQDAVRDLNPCVPGEFTLPTAYYVNTGSPRIIYRGTEEGTLPLVAGKWYLIPSDAVDRNPRLRQDAVPVARARRLIG